MSRGDDATTLGQEEEIKQWLRNCKEDQASVRAAVKAKDKDMFLTVVHKACQGYLDDYHVICTSGGHELDGGGGQFLLDAEICASSILDSLEPKSNASSSSTKESDLWLHLLQENRGAGGIKGFEPTTGTDGNVTLCLAR